MNANCASKANGSGTANELRSSYSPILQVSELQVGFAENGRVHPVVSDVALEIGVGETVGLVGESGSGKSLSCLSLLGLGPRHTVVGGRATFHGKDGAFNLIHGNQALRRQLLGRSIGVVFQEPMLSLNPLHRIGDQIAESLRHQGYSETERRKVALQLLERVGISDVGTRARCYPHEISGGMRQRVMIAIAVACRPQLLIADEPTTALDVTVQSQVLTLIKELQREIGMAVLFVTHDLGVVAEIADRVVVMQSGRIVESAPVAQIFTAPSKSYTRKLLAAVPRLGSMEGVLAPAKFEQSPDPSGPTSVKNLGAPLLDVADLRVRFDVRSGLLHRVSGRVHAVEDATFAVSVGETLSVVGESGSGKSTLGRTIAGLLAPQAGLIRIHPPTGGRNRDTVREHILKDVQMIFQDPAGSLNPKRRIFDSIAAPLWASGLSNRLEVEERVLALAKMVGLPNDLMWRLPHECSGGQKQRVCVARALATNPRLIVADECVSALDVSVKAQIVDLLIDLQQRMGISYLFISHDMAIVERISHRIAVMYMGSIVELGPRAAVIGNPQHAYTKKLLSAVPVPDPGRRRAPTPFDVEVQKSSLRRLDFLPSPAQYKTVGDGHLVKVEMDTPR